MKTAIPESTGLTAEQQLIVSCIRKSLSPNSTDQLTGFQGAQVDWDKTLKLVSRHGLLPLVSAGMPSGMMVPATVRAMLKTGYLGATVRTDIWLQPNLRRILEAFQSLDLDPIVIKGAALAHLAYPKPAYRTLSDVDIWLPESQIDRARGALVQLGLWTLTDVQHVDHHLPVHYVQEGQLGVELHYHLLKRPHPYSVRDEDFRARAQQATIAGVTTRVLSSTDALHYNCIHLGFAHRYQWYPLRSLVDILAITTTCADTLDWDLLQKNVRQSQTSGVVFWPLWLSRTLLGAPVPDSVLESFAPPWVIRRAVAAAFNSDYFWDLNSAAARDALNQALVEFSLHTGCSTIQQAQVALRCIFPPPTYVGHLPADVTRSRLRYAAHLANPIRVMHAIRSVSHLLEARSSRESQASTPPTLGENV